MTAKPFDLADWQRRLNLASGDELLALTEEILARNAERSQLSEPPLTQDKAATQEAHDEWVATYTTRKMRDMAAKALALTGRRR